MVNIVVITGRLGKDVELKRTDAGIAVAPFSIACKRKDNTDWFDVVAWRASAEYISKYGKKGRMVCVKGSLQKRQYEKDGKLNTVVEIVAESIEFMDSQKVDDIGTLQNKFEELNEEEDGLPF